MNLNINLTPLQLQNVFPFHIAIDSNLIIRQVGTYLIDILKKSSDEKTCVIVGQPISNYFAIVYPPRSKWTWKLIKMAKDSSLDIDMTDLSVVARPNVLTLPLRGRLVITNPTVDPDATEEGAVLLLCLRFTDGLDLQKAGYSLADISKFTFQREMIFAAEHLRSEIKSSHKLDMLSKSLEDEKAKTTRLLETKRGFVRYVSHEIRTPLNVVLMGLNLMQENALAAASVDGFSELQRQETDATLDLIADMKGSTTMAVDILNDLLTYEKVDSNLLTIEKQDMNMYEVIKSVLLMFKAQARGVGVAFSWDLENSRGVMCEVDGAKIVQVLRNLMSNAIKFTPSGGRVLVAAQIVPVGSSFELPETMSECLLAPSAASARTTSVLTSPRGELHDFNKNHTSLTRKTSQSSKHRSPYILEEVGSEELNEGSDENVAPVTVQSSSTVLVDHQGAISTATVEGRDDWPQAEEAKPKPSPNASSTFSGFVGRLIARCTRSNPNSPKSAPLPAVDPVPVVGQVSESTTPVNPAVPEKEPVGQVVVAAPVLTSVVNTQQTFAPNPVIYSLSSKGDVRSSSFDSAGGSLSSKNFASTKERVLAFPKSDSGDDFEAIKFDRMLRISVTDTGQGVAPEDQSALFAEFKQVRANHQATTNTGSGLGLWVARNIMEVHQGAIGVRSEGAGLGSSFFIDIPVRRIDRSSSLPRSRQASSSNGSPAQSSKYISRPSPSPSPSSKNIFKYSPSPPDAMNSISVRSMSEKGTIKEISQESKLTSVQLNLLADPNTVAPAPAPVTNTSLETNNATAVDPIPSATMPEPGASIGIEAATPVSIPTIAAVETPTVPSAIRATVPIGPVAAPISPTSPAVTTPTSVVVMPLKKVLIVDDVAVNRKMLRKIMEKRAQSIEEAADGNEAVDKSMVYLPDNPNPYDVVMMDFVMPKMNGPEATRQMRALGYTGLIVGVTGNSLQADIDFFMESGADEVFIKPLNVEKFVNYLKEKLNMPDLR